MWLYIIIFCVIGYLAGAIISGTGITYIFNYFNLKKSNNYKDSLNTEVSELAKIQSTSGTNELIKGIMMIAGGISLIVAMVGVTVILIGFTNKLKEVDIKVDKDDKDFSKIYRRFDINEYVHKRLRDDFDNETNNYYRIERDPAY